MLLNKFFVWVLILAVIGAGYGVLRATTGTTTPDAGSCGARR